MTDLVKESPVLSIPRGGPDTAPLQLDMTKIYQAEARVSEIAVSNIATVAELISVFNDAINTATKYISWLKYETVKAKKEFDLAKATVIIDVLPQKAMDLKDSGQKPNEDYRKALVDRDPACRAAQDIVDILEATSTFLSAKVKTLERAYWDCKDNVKRNTTNPATPALSMPSTGLNPIEAPGQEPQQPISFIGTTKY